MAIWDDLYGYAKGGEVPYVDSATDGEVNVEPTNIVKGKSGDAWDWAVTGMSGGHGYVPQGYGYAEDQYGPLRGNEQGARGFEDYLAGKYRGQIEGRGPSLAERQLAESTAQNQQQQMSMARSGNGPLGSAGAQYEAARNAAGISQMANRQAATLRAQEQQMAMQNASGLAGQQRSGDLGRLQAEQGYQIGKGNTAASLEGARATQAESEAARRADASLFGLGAGASAIGSMLSDARLKEAPGGTFDPEAEMARLYSNPYQWTPAAPPPEPMPMPVQQPPARPAYDDQGAGALGGALGGMLSDETAKRGPARMHGADMDEFLQDLEGYRYRYKNGTGEDTTRDRVGVMAQDLERDPVGATFVSERPDGYKQIEVDKGFGTALAALGRLNERIDALEKRRG